MIKLILGNLGSGKTALAVKDIAMNLNDRITYSNIKTNLSNQVDIKPEMIIMKEVTGEKKLKNGEVELQYKYKLNKDFWQKLTEKGQGINIVLDEASNLIDSRRSMSKVSQIFTQWLFMLRRVLGQTDAGTGHLTFITQLINTIDIRARDLATNIVYTICHFLKTCKTCGATWNENSEMPEGYLICPICKSHEIFKHTHKVECWYFANVQLFNVWHQFGMNTHYKHTMENKIEEIFPNYNTLQWESLFGEYF